MFTMLSSSSKQLVVLAYLLVGFTSVFGVFFAVAPKEFRPGWPLTVAVTAHQNVSGKVFVNIVLGPKDDKIDVYSAAADSLQPGETKTITMQVPEITLSSPSLARLSVTTTGAVTFDMAQDVTYNPESSLVLVETDKAIYKPGQKVQFRVVHVDKSLKPVIKPLTVFIVNPKDNKLEEYKDIASNTGVMELVYELSDSASLGNWTIQVTDKARMHYTKQFIVEEYVLPKFSVEVKANPGYLVLENGGSNPVIVVDALYTYGRGVQGDCVLTLSDGERIISSTKQLNHLGKAEFTDLDWSSVVKQRPWYIMPISAKATVKDETGRTEAGQATVMVHKYNTKVQILPKSTKILRIGMPAEIFVRVSDQNGNPVNSPEVTMNIKARGVKSVTTNLKVPEGETDVSFKFVVKPKDSDDYNWSPNEVQVKLTTKSEISATQKIYLYSSLNGSSVVLQPTTEEIPVVGDAVQFNVSKNSKNWQNTVGYVVVSQGNILAAGTPVDNVISLTPTLEMCPHAQLMVYMIAGDSKLELVTDIFKLSPTRCFGKEVDVSFDAAEVRSGTDTSMKIRVNRVDGSNALPGVHSVYYLAVDKSLILLQGRTDLNTEQVLQGLSSFSFKPKPRWASSDQPHAADSMINELGLTVFTSVVLEGERDYEDRAFMNVGAEVFDDDVILLSDFQPTVNTEQKPEPKEEVASTKIRKNFPETWLWGQGQTHMNGQLTQTVTLPDTITTWMVSAFAVNSEGLAVGHRPFELAAFQMFFLTMNLPYSIKRGEVFTLRITVFNYRRKDVNAVVRLLESNQFQVINGSSQNGWHDHELKMAANKASSVEFKISATTLGLIELHVVAEDLDDGVKDEVKQNLLVKPEGEMRPRAITKLLILDPNTTLTETFTINWPEEKIVSGSKKVEVKVTGNVMGQSLSNLNRLVSVPYGCGEQNMITTVPNIYGLSYIKATQQDDMREMAGQMTENMKRGYQRQVDNYRHRDGSYSAWGDRSDETAKGSVWLTAFVLKSFSRAAEFITIDPKVLSSAASFLTSKQASSGAFTETGQVFHSEMQSGTGSGSGLTLYVLISLLEAKRNTGEEMNSLQQPTTQASKYIREMFNPRSLRQSGNKYLAMMAAYALSLMPDGDHVTLIDQLLELVRDLGAPWIDNSGPSYERATKVNMGIMEKPHSAALDVETAAYCLLTLTKLGRLGEGVEVMRWLQSQQNSMGGYYSTQDTIMALQALSDFGITFISTLSVSNVNVREPESGQSFNVSLTGSRSVLLQTVELPEETNKVEITATGPANSLCVVKVAYSYYTLAGDDDLATSEPEVVVITKSNKVSNNIHRVEACIRSSNSLKYNGMFVTTLTLPSGEEAFDEPATILANNPRASKIETGQGLIHFYINEAPGEGYCLHAQVERQMDFEVQKPGSAKFYAYYQTETFNEVPLILEDVSPDGGNGGTVLVNMASIVLTAIICVLTSLLICM